MKNAGQVKDDCMISDMFLEIYKLVVVIDCVTQNT